MTRRRKHGNPLINGILLFLDEHTAPESSSRRSNGSEKDVGIPDEADLPKRFTWYEPLILLNERFEQQSQAWTTFYSGLIQAQRDQLFNSICQSFNDSGKHSTHIAVNAPIQLHDQSKDNILRAPTNLKPLFGDFGPSELSTSSQPGQQDFQTALWVSTSQLPGIIQVWAPCWTMFSRGNIREKARILGAKQHNPSPFPGFTEAELGCSFAQVDVVDFYIGIGYFALPYLKRGVRRVFGWDLNAWSIEGLTRSCKANGIECHMDRIEDTAEAMETISRNLLTKLETQPNVRCFGFVGDNSSAPPILQRLQKMLEEGQKLNIRHCNLGLLPSSFQSYAAAISVLSANGPGWLHVHENVDMNAVQAKQQQIQQQLRQILVEQRRANWELNCDHVELVKTYAPGIGHFVFDMRFDPAS